MPLRRGRAGGRAQHARAAPLTRPRIAGRATRAGTERYAAGAGTAPGHFSDLPGSRLRLSSLGIGTLGGGAPEVVAAALQGGLNVIDGAVHYRNLEAIGEGLRASGVPREAMFIAVKGGLALEGEDGEIEQARAALGLDTLDAFVVDAPERHVAALGKEAMHARLRATFARLERAHEDGRIGCYGIATFDALRVETDAPLFQSLAALRGLGGKGLELVQLPFNPAMTEGLARFSQATGLGNVASALQAARQLGFWCMASHALGKGGFATHDPLAEQLPMLANPAQRALQFARSTPGVAVALAGASSLAHLADLLAVARVAPVGKDAYSGWYRRA